MAHASSLTCTARRGLALLSVAALLSCSTKYQPQLGPRLSIVMEGGSPVYVRDGKKFEHGFAGGGLVDAVEDDPEAKAAAETYHSRMTSGFALYLVGTACLITGVSVGLSHIDDNQRSNSTDALAIGGLLCGFAGLISGGVLLVSGQPYQMDAINIYNDNVERRRLVPAPPIYVGTPGYTPYAPVPVLPAKRPVPTAPPPPPPPPATDGGASAPDGGPPGQLDDRR